MGAGVALNLSREFLIEEHVNKGKSCYEISKEIGCDPNTVLHYADKYDVLVKRKGKRSLDLTGCKFGKIEVLRRLGRNSHGHIEWLCRCKCGKECKITTGSLRSKHTRSCGCNYQDRETNKAKYVGEIGSRVWYQIQGNAFSRAMTLEITREEIWELFLKQNRKCALTGMELVFAKTDKEERAGMRTASLDRIDSSKGYTIDNVQWVHKDINKMKMHHSDDKFIHHCHLVAAHHPKPGLGNLGDNNAH